MPRNFRRLADGAGHWLAPSALLVGVETLLLLGLGVAVAGLAFAILTPVGPIGAWAAPQNAAHAGDATVIGSFDPFFRGGSEPEAARVSTLSLTLLGTRVDMISGRGSAIIATPDGVQSSFLVGETIAPGVTLKAVGFDEITLASSGGDEKLFLDQSGSAAGAGAAASANTEASGTQPFIQQPVAASATPAPRLAADIAVAARVAAGEITGFVLSPKGSGRAFSAAGLQAGDVLVSVDGAPVSSVRDPATLTQRLDAGAASLGIERGGRLVNIRTGGN
jgi:general secretion pathway protein C